MKHLATMNGKNKNTDGPINKNFVLYFRFYLRNGEKKGRVFVFSDFNRN